MTLAKRISAGTDLKFPKGLSLKQHQKDALDFLKVHNRCYLRLDPGLGKTIIAAVACKILDGFSVFITPPALIENVREEFTRWAPDLVLGVFGGRRSDYSRLDVLIIADSVISQITYYFLRGLIDHMRRSRHNLETAIFVDEAHRFTNDKAIRTSALLGHGQRQPGLVDLFRRTIYMSGTPLSNRPMELYPILSKSAPEAIGGMNRYEFGMRYCAGKKIQIGWGRRPKFAWDFKGHSNLAELASRIIHPKGSFMLRMKKDQLKLPPKIEEVFVFSRTMSPRLASMNKGIGEQYEDIDDLIKAEIGGTVRRGGNDIHLATYRRKLGQEKVPVAIQYLETLLEETDESILVFALHRDVISELSFGLMTYKPIVITGRTNPKKRQCLVREFQESDCRLAILNYKAAGVGFTLTKATRVVFVEFSWNPADNDQASDRAHRIGQNKTVYVQYMCYKDSIDKKVIEALLTKRDAARHL